MQWSKVKNLIIIVLLAADIFLAASALSKYFSSRAAESEAVKQAWQIAQTRGVSGDEKTFLSMPAQTYIWTCERDAERERQIAYAICGQDCACQVSGEVYQYSGRGALAVFRSGGYFELYFDAERPDNAEEFFASALKNAGIPVKDAVWSDAEQGVSGSFSRAFRGCEVTGAFLQCGWENGRASVEGRWFFTEPKRLEQAKSRAQMILEFADGTEKKVVGDCVLKYAFNGITLTPVWEIAYVSDGQQGLESVS